MSYKIEGAVIKEQGVTFAIVVVKQHVLQNSIDRENAQRSFGTIFPGMPIILMAQDLHGTPKYYGRKDIVGFLANVNPSRIPWKRYTVD